MRAAQPDTWESRRTICGDKLRASEPWKPIDHQTLRRDRNIDARLKPGRMPRSKQPRLAIPTEKSGIPFHREFSEAAGRAILQNDFWPDSAAIPKSEFAVFDCSRQFARQDILRVAD